jgi:adhesin HecA-like repeat protein
MKKTLLATSVALLMGAGAADAAFLQAGSTGTIDLTAGCFTFGDCAIGGLGNVTDNAITVRGAGTGIAGDGKVGSISFTVGGDGNTLIIDSFQQDTYTGTAGGDFALNVGVANSSGFVSDTGDLSLSMERFGFPNFFPIWTTQSGTLTTLLVLPVRVTPPRVLWMRGLRVVIATGRRVRLAQYQVLVPVPR